MSTPRSLPQVRRLVVKVGSAVLAPDGELDESAVARLAQQLAAVAPGREIVLVSSGAVASGFRLLGEKKPPREIALKQAAAAIGQSRLMAAYARAFAALALSSNGGTGVPPVSSPLAVAQVLLTADDLDNRTRFLNARTTLDTLLSRGIIPIINENDSVSYAEIKLGDNDRLSALVAALVRADLLLILSTARGLYENNDPRKVIPVIWPADDAAGNVAAATSGVGTGGMGTKLAAVELARTFAIPTIIAGGSDERVVERALGGEPLGTYFPIEAPAKPGAKKVRARKGWLGFSTRPRGSIIVDDGARVALVKRHASLLPSGVLGVEGHFAAGAPVDIRVKGGKAFARGLASYSAEDIRKIKGCKASQIAAILGSVYRDEVVHKDDLMILDAEAQSAQSKPRP